MMFALIMGAVAAYAQQGSGDYYEGLSRKIGFSQMIPPHGLEITYDKTVHIIFPSPVRYVDLGSPNLIAGKADGAENVIRVKATRKHFRNETNIQSREQLFLHFFESTSALQASLLQIRQAQSLM